MKNVRLLLCLYLLNVVHWELDLFIALSSLSVTTPSFKTLHGSNTKRKRRQLYTSLSTLIFEKYEANHSNLYKQLIQLQIKDLNWMGYKRIFKLYNIYTYKIISWQKQSLSGTDIQSILYVYSSNFVSVEGTPPKKIETS